MDIIDPTTNKGDTTMKSFTETNTQNVLGLCLTMYHADLNPVASFEMLKASLMSNDYGIDEIELELYQVKQQCRNGLNKDAETWAQGLIDQWVNG
jgi:hypothetical protein